MRTQETAKLVQKELGLPDSAVMVDERLREIGFGAYDGKPVEEWRKFIGPFANRFTMAAEKGETYVDVRKRVGEFLFEIEKRYTDKNILIVSHIRPIWNLKHVAQRHSIPETMQETTEEPVKNAIVEEVPFTLFPHNAEYELDLHRPYIDEVPMGNSVDGKWERIPDVFDCWYESGSMPYASNHYPFKKEAFNPKRFLGLAPKGFPADFIAEGLDQTRGWFYSLIVLGTGLFGRSPYKNVIVNGLVLASDGQKMSKRLRNYPDPMEVVEKYGADSLRYYLLSSSVIRAEDLRFNERGVEEVSKKLLMRLDNVRSFYDLYAAAPLPEKSRGEGVPSRRQDGAKDFFLAEVSQAHVLDRWILSRLGELVRDTTAGFERYELDAAVRPLASFIDDLSTWYLRRSRDRFKEEGEDKTQALAVLRHILRTTAQVMAPVMPFFADDLFKRMKSETDEESVHLSQWPAAQKIDAQLLADMAKTRELASQALLLRERASLKVRQPLSKLTIKYALSSELKAVLMSEINVKEVVEDAALSQDTVLETELTDELREEGTVRDLVRRVQEWRKSQGLQIADRPSYTLIVTKNEEAAARKHQADIAAQTGLDVLTIEVGQ
jgi:isoleucyl-tRNA synthetase